MQNIVKYWYFYILDDAEPLPSTPEQPEEVEEHGGAFVDEEEDDNEDEDYLPSQGQQSGSSASFLNPSSQNIEVSETFKLHFNLNRARGNGSNMFLKLGLEHP